MKKRDKNLDDFWDGLEVTRADDDRELQRKTLLGADALVNAALRGFFRGVSIAIGIVILLYAIEQFQVGHH